MITRRPRKAPPWNARKTGAFRRNWAVWDKASWHASASEPTAWNWCCWPRHTISFCMTKQVDKKRLPEPDGYYGLLAVIGVSVFTIVMTALALAVAALS